MHPSNQDDLKPGQLRFDGRGFEHPPWRGSPNVPTDFDTASNDVLLPVTKELNFVCAENSDTRRCREVCPSNGKLELRIF
jgi:hypothetical protein